MAQQTRQAQAPQRKAAPPAAKRQIAASRAAAPQEEEQDEGGEEEEPPQRQPARRQAAAPQRGRAREKSDFNTSRRRGSRASLVPIDDYTAAVYRVRVNRLERILPEESRNPKPVDSSIIELEVLESENPKCPVGYVASATFTDRHFEEIYHSEVKGFLGGLLDLPDEEIDEDMWNDVFRNNVYPGTEDSCLGAELMVTVRFKLREDKHPITEYVWVRPDAE